MPDQGQPAKPLRALTLELTASSLSSLKMSPSLVAPTSMRGISYATLGVQLGQMKMATMFQTLVPGASVTISALLKVL